jgi:exonuclease SbcD
VRFLHTADWHVGKTLRGRSRMDELASALDEVTQIAVAERVDAVLVAGDVFDSPAPPAEAEKLVYDFLARLLPERIACVVIAGNHDHPRKLGALARLLEGLRIYVRSEVRPPSEGGVVSLASRDGTQEARVAVLPFIFERKVVDACRLLGPEHEWYEEYARRTEQILAHLVEGFAPDSVNLVLAHLHVAGARLGTGERSLHVRDVYGVEAERLPSSAQYVGLGHLHRPQRIDAKAPTFYAGSLIELDFGEREQDRRVLIVEAEPGRPAVVESVPLTAGRRLRDVEGTLEQLARLSDDVGSDHLRVGVRVDAPVPGIAEQVKQMLPGTLEVRLIYEQHVPLAELAGRASLEPVDLFSEFYRRKHGAEPAEALVALFRDVHAEAAEP